VQEPDQCRANRRSVGDPDPPNSGDEFSEFLFELSPEHNFIGVFEREVVSVDVKFDSGLQSGHPAWAQVIKRHGCNYDHAV